MKLRLLLAAVAALACSAFGAVPQAGAATTIGVIPSQSPTVSEGGILAFSPTAVYAVPFPGVITSWTAPGGRVDPLRAVEVELEVFKVAEEQGSGALTATVVGDTRLFGLEEEPKTRFARVPVSGGEYIGVRYPKPGPQFPAGGESIACSAEGIGARGTTYVEGKSLICESGQGVAVSATLEPDEDDDGFGDQTQDRCLGVAGEATGCRGLYRDRVRGSLVELRVGTRTTAGKDGERPFTVIEGNKYDIRLRCWDDAEFGFLLSGGVRKGQPVRVRDDGRFDYSRGLAAGGGVVTGRTRVSGRVAGPKIHGTIRGTVTMRHHGKCPVVPFRWTISD
jgi:hypothetical protein